MKYYIGFTVVFTFFRIFTGGETACDESCKSERQTDTCKLITVENFRCIYKTKFTKSRTFNITSFHKRKIYNCNTISVNDGTVTFECPFDYNYTLHQITLTITTTDRNNENTLVVKTNLTQFFRPPKVTNVEIHSSPNIGISLHANIYQKPLLHSTTKFVHVIFFSTQNFHEPIQHCFEVRGPSIKKTWEGFHPYETYIVKIYWKNENGDFCSPVVHGSVRTHPSKPTAAPQILKGSYSDTLPDYKSALYWKAISKYHENGPSINYIIYKLPTHIMKDNYALLHNFTSLMELDNVSHIFNVSNLEQFEIASVDKSVCSVMFSHDVLPGDHLVIRTKNSEGSSDAYASIEFTSKGKHMVDYFFANQLNQSHFELSWTSNVTMPTTFEVVLYWCNGYYWTIPGWTECKNNISEITISSLELERTESAFKLIQMIASEQLPVTNPSSTEHKLVARGLSDDNTMPPIYLQFGVSIQKDGEFSPIVWNATTLSDRTAQGNNVVYYIMIAVIPIIILILLLLICVYCRQSLKKSVFKKYKISMPKSIDQCDSENGAECTALPTNNSDQKVDRQLSDSGIGELSISMSSSCSSSPELVIPVSSTDTSNISSTGEFPKRKSSLETTSPVIHVETEGPKVTKQDALRNALATKTSPNKKLVQNSYTSSSKPKLMLKPISQSKTKEVTDELEMMEYSIATIQDTNDNKCENENNSASTYVPYITYNSKTPSITNKQNGQKQLESINNIDTPDNTCDEDNYPSTSIVIHPDSEEIMC